VSQDRDRLRDLSARLLRLHGILLDRERRAYEERARGNTKGDDGRGFDRHRTADFAWLFS